MNIQKRPSLQHTMVGITESAMTNELLSEINGHLLQIRESVKRASYTSDSILDMDECSVLLKIKKATLYQMTRRGLLPARKLGRKLIFIYSELMKWVKDHPSLLESSH